MALNGIYEKETRVSGPVSPGGGRRFVAAWLVSAGLVALALGSGTGCGSSTATGGPGGTGGVTTVQCTQDTDCNSGEFCDQATGACGAKDPTACTSDSECGPDETCDMTSGYCLFAGCSSDSECLPGEHCTNGTCSGSPMTEPTCHQCACMDLLSAGGCANVCDSAQNGNPNTPNFCNGQNALPQCAKCLADNCGAITDPPSPTDPSACN